MARGLAILAVSSILFACATDPLAASTPRLCDAPELLGFEPYDRLVCQGISQLAEGDPQSAAKTFEVALAIRLFEHPNFKLLPRLAIAHHRAGDSEAAERALEKARVAISVYVRLLRCRNDPPPTTLVQRSGGADYPLTSPLHDDMVYLMCGEAYDYLYEPQKLEEVASEGEIVQLYLDAKAEIFDAPRARR